MDKWDGIGNSVLLGLRENHPLQNAGMWHDERYNKGDLSRNQVTAGFLKKGWLQAASSVWDAGSALLVMTAATVIVPVWDFFRYEQKSTKDESH